MILGKAFSALSVLLILVSSVAALADDAIPNCPDLDGSALPLMNQTVAGWKQSEANQWRHRARIRGTITDLYADHSGHHHFGIQISDNASDDVEVIYNEDFGPVPELSEGMTVEACGDFIVSTAPAGGYDASPLGAIIHWVHKNPKGKGHPSGYLWINGTLCGQDAEHAGPKKPGPWGEPGEQTALY